jgi:hypothetical protein
MLLLTGGNVLCQDAGGPDWWRLRPDRRGSYVNGTWAKAASGPNAPLWYASAVLADGRVFVAGGEYNNGNQADLCAAEIYDPVADHWTSIPTPPGWSSIGDASSCVLPDGRVMLGSIEGPQCSIYNPTTNSWSATGSKHNATTNEETWTLLPDGTVLSVDCDGHPAAEKYVIARGAWVSAGSTPVDLVEAASLEIGPALLLPDGRVFAIGATGRSALYTMPAVPNQPGSWTTGPSFPVVGAHRLGAKDAPACLLANGKVLCVAGPVDGVAGNYLGPTSFFEFDPPISALAAVPNPPNNGDAPYTGRLLPLPSGEVLFANQTTDVEVYIPHGAPLAAWKPRITSFPGRVYAGGVYPLQGTQLNGRSQAASYGDDVQMATNYPLARLIGQGGEVIYCRTFNHSTMGVATGNTVAHTTVVVPTATSSGRYTLEVVANGIASDPMVVDVVGPTRLRASVLAPTPDRRDVFVHGSDDALHHKWSDSGGWHPSSTTFEGLGGALNGEPVVVSQTSGRVDVLVRGTDDGLYHKWLDPAGWHPSPVAFEPLGGVLNGQPVVVPSSADRLDVFVRGVGDALQHKWLDATGWQPSPATFESLGGILAGDPAAVSWGPNRIDLFVRGSNDALYHKWWDGTSWYPPAPSYEALGGTLRGDPAAVCWGPNRIDVFVRGADDALYHKWWDGTAWRGFETLGGKLGGDPVVVSRVPNSLDAFVRGIDNGLYHKWWDGTAWHPSKVGFASLGGVLDGDAGVVASAGGRLDVFVRGTDKALYHKWWDTGAWHPSATSYERLGGAIL